jgi:hypothetical protein
MSKRTVLTLALAFIVLCLVACVIVLAPVIGDTMAHDRKLRRYQAALRAAPHPGGTLLVSAEKRVGLFVGNGHHCDYFVGELRQYSGSRQEIEEFYAGVSIEEHGPVSLLFVENGQFSGPARWTLPPRLDELSEWSVSPVELQIDVYLVYVLAPGFEPGHDIRCH